MLLTLTNLHRSSAAIWRSTCPLLVCVCVCVCIPDKFAPQLGGDLAVDVSFRFLEVFLEDDEELERIARDYSAGALLSGELKAAAIGCIQRLVAQHEKVTPPDSSPHTPTSPPLPPPTTPTHVDSTPSLLPWAREPGLPHYLLAPFSLRLWTVASGRRMHARGMHARGMRARGMRARGMRARGMQVALFARGHGCICGCVHTPEGL